MCVYDTSNANIRTYVLQIVCRRHSQVPTACPSVSSVGVPRIAFWGYNYSQASYWRGADERQTKWIWVAGGGQNRGENE
jgi:hypothetical protein